MNSIFLNVPWIWRHFAAIALGLWFALGLFSAGAMLGGRVIRRPASPGYLVYTARAWGPNTEIYLTHVNGMAPINLTYHPATDEQPSWAPDGSLIAFASNRDGQWAVYLADIPTGQTVRLTYGPGNDQSPVISPDGRWLAFVRRIDARTSLYLFDMEMLTAHFLTDVEVFWNLYPIWSPDSASIALVAIHSAAERWNPQIAVVSVGSGRLRWLTDRSGTRSWPAWSPDGTRLAFFSAETGYAELYLINADGSHLSQVTNQTQESYPCQMKLADPYTYYLNSGAYHPPLAWSPDGSAIVFAGKPLDAYGLDLCLVEIATGRMTNLTASPNNDVNPAWSPDGRQIAFQSWRDGNAEVYILDLPEDGSTPAQTRRITYWERDDWEPQWMPAPP